MPLAVALITMIALPSALYAKAGGEKVSRQPIIIESRNSQTIELLEAYININPTGTGGAEVAIVDGTALISEGGEGVAFVDSGKFGGQISVYVVREGDSLSTIADMFD
ncbi:MAG: hypothetical protein Q8O98_01290, partial [bacterium]|nr:hypothetical protein [bacterium]